MDSIQREKIRLGNLGKKRSPEIRERMRLVKLGVPRPDMLGNTYGFKKGKHPWNYGKKGIYTPEALAAMRARKLGGTLKAEHKAKIVWTGRHHSEESKRKMAVSKIGDLNPTKRPEVRAKLSDAASRPEVIDAKARQMPVSGTSIELAVRAELDRRGIAHTPNKQLLGRFNVDIFIEPNMVIECDGEYWHGSKEAKAKDRRRDRALRKAGYVVHRFWESEIKKDVVACIMRIYQ